LVEEEKIMQDIEIPKIVLNKSQEDLLKELRNISDLSSKLYLDIIKLSSIDFLDTKSHLVSHLMRELDSGIRKALAYKENPELLSEDEINDIHKVMKKEFKQKGFKNKPKKPNEYVESICKILDKNKDLKLITEWTLSGSQLHHFAHRGQFNTDVRPFHLIVDIWERYENLLFQIVGSPMALIGIFDKYFTQETPTNEQLGILNNLLEKPNYQSYFYSNLKQRNWLKPLDEKNFFNPSDNPKPQPTEDGNGYYILSWSIFRYLEWVSNNLPDDDNYIKGLVKIIDAIIAYKEDEKRINNFRTDFSIYKILTNIQSKYVTNDHIKFIKDSLEMHFHGGMISAELSRGFITKLISEDNKEILLELVDVACSYVKTNGDVESLMETYWFKELVEKHKTELADYVGLEISDLLIKKIKEIKTEDPHSFSIVWIPTIDTHEQKSFSDRYESQLLDLLIECLKKLPDEDLLKYSEQLIKSEFDILKRIGFYLIGVKFDILKDIFFNLDFNPLEDLNTKHEIYELLKLNAEEFSDEQIEVLVKWIEENEYYLDDVKEEDKDYVLAYRKKEWYLSLLKSENKSVQDNYSKYDEINDETPEHPGFVSWHTSWAGESTPMEEFQIENSTIAELIKVIKEFKEEKGFRTPTVRGFADTIQRDVEKQPSKYSDSLDLFKEVDLAYLCAIARGFINLGTKNIQEHKLHVELDWDKILNFLNRFIDDSFWSADHTGEFNYKEWFVAEVARLIEAGTKQDETAFDVKLLPLAKEILLKLTTHEFYYEMNTEDHVNYTLNSTEGKILDAMLNYSLRVYRQVEKKFDNDIKAHFEKKLNEKKYLEVYTTLGQYLPHFNTLDKEWVSSKFDLIFPMDNDMILNASISGLFFNSTVYAEFYKLLKEKGIYKKILDNWASNRKNTNESLLRHICLGYAEKWEEIQDGSLIKNLLEIYDSLDEIVRFFWIIAKNMKTEYKPRVKALWKHITDNNPNTQVTGKIMEWLNIFDELDDNLFNLCMAGAKYVEGHHAHYIIEYLLKFLDDKSEEVGKILLEMVRNINLISDYKKEDVIKIVETLYNNQNKQLADDICNQYFDKQNLLFLRELYAINNSSTEGGNQDD
jgi:hypothetical protein